VAASEISLQDMDGRWRETGTGNGKLAWGCARGQPVGRSRISGLIRRAGSEVKSGMKPWAATGPACTRGSRDMEGALAGRGLLTLRSRPGRPGNEPDYRRLRFGATSIFRLGWRPRDSTLVR
jgi:hypothetical protein